MTPGYQILRTEGKGAQVFAVTTESILGVFFVNAVIASPSCGHYLLDHSKKHETRFTAPRILTPNLFCLIPARVSLVLERRDLNMESVTLGSVPSGLPHFTNIHVMFGASDEKPLWYYVL